MGYASAHAPPLPPPLAAFAAGARPAAAPVCPARLCAVSRSTSAAFWGAAAFGRGNHDTACGAQAWSPAKRCARQCTRLHAEHVDERLRESGRRRRGAGVERRRPSKSAAHGWGVEVERRRPRRRAARGDARHAPRVARRALGARSAQTSRPAGARARAGAGVRGGVSVRPGCAGRRQPRARRTVREPDASSRRTARRDVFSGGGAAASSADVWWWRHASCVTTSV
jgi:hypothetical protein